MPRYIIERQYFVPKFEHIMIDAPTFEDACRQAVDDLSQLWSEEAELCFDDARPTTVTYAVQLPDDYKPDEEQDEFGIDRPLSSLLYCAGLDPLSIPNEFGGTRAEAGEPGVGFA